MFCFSYVSHFTCINNHFDLFVSFYILMFTKYCTVCAPWCGKWMQSIKICMHCISHVRCFWKFVLMYLGKRYKLSIWFIKCLCVFLCLQSTVCAFWTKYPMWNSMQMQNIKICMHCISHVACFWKFVLLPLGKGVHFTPLLGFDIFQGIRTRVMVQN